jgi:hypothetical protein
VVHAHERAAALAGLADALQAEGLHVEARRLLGIGNGKRNVPKFSHPAIIARLPVKSAPSVMARIVLPLWV